MDVVNHFLEGRIKSSVDDTKFADLYSIENIWAVMKEKTRKTFENRDYINDFINCE